VARKRSPNLTEAELRLMHVLWDKGAATVSEVADALPEDLGLAYNTVLTTLRILENKGYVRHAKAKEGRAFVYRPLVDRDQASRSAVRHLISRFFRDSPELLVLNVLQDRDLTRKELQRIRKLIEESSDEGTGTARQ
jgi:predicted transcriptional regulator